MKFEKFLKETGTHGQIYERENGDKWLICGGVGCKVPMGVVNILGVGVITDKTKQIMESVIHADTDAKVELRRAMINDPAGKSSDIVRVFGNGIDIEIGITNGDFGLIEKKDINLAHAMIDDPEDDLKEIPFLLILDQTDEVVGFIAGSEV